LKKLIIHHIEELLVIISSLILIFGVIYVIYNTERKQENIEDYNKNMINFYGSIFDNKYYSDTKKNIINNSRIDSFIQYHNSLRENNVIMINIIKKLINDIINICYIYRFNNICDTLIINDYNCIEIYYSTESSEYTVRQKYCNLFENY